MDLRGETTAILLILGVIVCYLRDVSCHSDHALVLLISFDGFRHDYLQNAKAAGKNTPNFDKLIASGVKATFLQNSFITKTFPNHYTIATGLYEENHGVIANNMYDPDMDEVFTNSRIQSSDERWWNNGTDNWGGDPIWLHNERGSEHDVFPRRSGVFFWPGSEAPIRGKHPTHYIPYNKSIDYDVRINHIVDWFADDDKPINLGVLYFEEPDASGHKYGPDSNKVYEVIEELDGHLGHLLQRLDDSHLSSRINIIITSDHGMTKVDKVIDLSKYVNTSLFEHFGGSPIFNILPNNGSEDEVYDKLKEVPNLHVYRREDIPRNYHYTYNRRILPILASAAEHYHLCVSEDHCGYSVGNHGYNNSLDSMHPFFIAHGPAFKENYVSGFFNNVDIYPLMCEILNIQPALIDGNLDRIKHILRPPNNTTITLLTYLGVAAFTALITGIFVVSVLKIQRIHTHRRLLNPRRRTSPMNNAYVDDPGDIEDGKTHLLMSDEEEIP